MSMAQRVRCVVAAKDRLTLPPASIVQMIWLLAFLLKIGFAMQMSSYQKYLHKTIQRR